MSKGGFNFHAEACELGAFFRIECLEMGFELQGLLLEGVFKGVAAFVG